MKLLTRYDILIVFGLITAVLLLALTRDRGSSFAEVYHDGRLIRTVNLKVDSEFSLAVGMLIKVEKGKISVIDSDCPDKLCVLQGAVDSPNIPIVCVPNRIVIKIPSGRTEVDVITQ
ncbi:MAG TPA: NusG domain II-containing protein [Mesotoga infera]|uniref:NusG domain II-containing protein n=1 Tax=Mesotoga infera TaxID=1236046 RepID=A0A7C1CXC3_9BACT|nr:NusG domain II-containing protein [Mesotoga infera]